MPSASSLLGPYPPCDIDFGPLEKLIDHAATSNPTQYEIPARFACNMPLPGTSKKPKPKENKSKKPTPEYNGGLAHLPNNLCYHCKKTCRHAPLIQCDYCPLLFHADCLYPPLTSLPTSRWMCPNHAEHLIDKKVLACVSLTERVKLWDKFGGPVNQDAIKLNFLNKINKPNPPFRRQVKLPERTKLTVPNNVTHHYSAPPMLLPRIKDPLPMETIKKSPCKKEEFDRWVRKLVEFQLDVITKQIARVEPPQCKTEYVISPDDIHCRPVIIDSSLRHSRSSEPNSAGSTGTSNICQSPGVTYHPVKIKVEECKSTIPSNTQMNKNTTKVSFDMANSSQGVFLKPQDKLPQYQSSSTFINTPESITNTPKKDLLVDDDLLDKMDDKLIRLCAYQYLKQVTPKKPVLNDKNVDVKEIRARAVLVPLDICRDPVPMPYRTLHLGLGDDMEVCFPKFGNCKYVSAKHATIYFDEYTRQYELLNYSAFGTVVDNVLYCSDISEKQPTPAPSALSAAMRRQRKNTPRLQNMPPPFEGSSESREKLPPMLVCRCQGKPTDIMQDQKGDEGSAMLHHGSLIKCGCLQFVFSVTEYGYLFQYPPFTGSYSSEKLNTYSPQ